jgi:hypoxanthine phosphoribosyltransferase
MSEKKSTLDATGSEGIDYSGRPFGYLNPDSETAMICEKDPAIRDEISKALKALSIDIVEPTSFKEALRYLRFHIFNVIVVDENFDTGVGEVNYVLHYAENLIMPIRRQTFVVLISETYPTMDNMRAYNKSVNLIINKKEIAEAALILKKEIAEDSDFYYLFKENLNKSGKI